MKAVWKYVVELDDTVSRFPLAKGEKVVLVDQDPATGKVAFWAEVDPNLVRQGMSRGFQIFGTGHGIPDDSTHVGSIVIQAFVWHLYEIH